MRAFVIIPALNEAATVGAVVAALPREAVQEVVVVDGGSADGTAEVARRAGATVVTEPRRGYGRAALAGLAVAAQREAEGQAPQAVAWIDADGADRPEELTALLAPLAAGTADLAIGSRVLGARQGRVEAGALAPHQRAGNALACALLRLRWGHRATDLGPFRAIRWEALRGLGMRDATWGWTVEMQARAARAGLRIAEVPVSYRPRQAGTSTISGSVSGSVRAGAKILWTVGALAVQPSPRPARA